MHFLGILNEQKRLICVLHANINEFANIWNRYQQKQERPELNGSISYNELVRARRVYVDLQSGTGYYPSTRIHIYLVNLNYSNLLSGPWLPVTTYLEGLWTPDMFCRDIKISRRNFRARIFWPIVIYIIQAR